MNACRVAAVVFAVACAAFLHAGCPAPAIVAGLASIDFIFQANKEGK